jgi:hypothetical protein
MFEVVTGTVKDVLGVKTKILLVGFWQELARDLIEPLNQFSIGAVAVNQDAGGDDDRFLS